MRASHRRTLYTLAILMWWLAIHAVAGRSIRALVLDEWWQRLPRYPSPEEVIDGLPSEIAAVEAHRPPDPIRGDMISFCRARSSVG